MRRGLTIATLALALAAGAACGTDDERPGPPASGGRGGAGATSGSAGKGGAGRGGADSGGGEGGDGATGNDGGSGAAADNCGDGSRDADEECDGDDFAALGCTDFGFDSGDLACTEDCSVETSGCVGVEHCADGQDNDGDEDLDCADADCSEACADPCSDPAALADPGQVTASNADRANVVAASCVADGDGPDVAYRFVAEQSGTLEIELDSLLDLAVSVHESCAIDSADIACDASFVSLPVTAGDELLVVVHGQAAAESGEFTLSAFSRENDVCSDGYVDPGEGCDDGNLEPGDGCDDNCAVETVESEPNATYMAATPYDAPHFADISPEGDADFVEISVPDAATGVVIEVLSLNEDCYRNRIDSLLTLFDTDGTTELALDDDSGPGKCSRISLPGLAAGTYFVRVSELGDDAVFPYELRVSID